MDANNHNNNITIIQNLDDDDEDEYDRTTSLALPRNIDFEVVGLLSDTNGRSCCSHEVCGEFLLQGDLCRLVKTVVTIKGVDEEAIKLVKIQDGVPTCTVGFVPRVHARSGRVFRNIGELCLVQEIYLNSTNTYTRSKAHKNRGMAGLSFTKNIPYDE